MGSGSVGGYLGARLAAAGQDVHFIARGRQLQAIREHGLTILSANGDLHLERVETTDDPAEIGPVDVVVFAVKLYDMAEAARAIAPLIGPETAVIPFLNGVECSDVLRETIGEAHTLGGVVYIFGVIEAPGVIRHTGTLNRFVFGELDGHISERAQAFYEACDAADGLEAVLSEDIEVELWRKMIPLSSLSGIMAVTRCPIGRLRDAPDTAALMQAAIAEATAVARAKGIALSDDIEARTWAYAMEIAPESRSSMLEDLERGRRLEAPWLNGAIVRLGEALGVPTPVHRFVLTALKPHIDGVRDGGT